MTEHMKIAFDHGDDEGLSLEQLEHIDLDKAEPKLKHSTKEKGDDELVHDDGRVVKAKLGVLKRPRCGK